MKTPILFYYAIRTKANKNEKAVNTPKDVQLLPLSVPMTVGAGLPMTVGAGLVADADGGLKKEAIDGFFSNNALVESAISCET